MSLSEKYDRVAEGFAEAEYADPARYNARRAALVFSLGPTVPPGATVLDLACGDASLAEEVLARGFRYIGADPSKGMCEAARRRVGDRGRIELGGFDDYEPPEPVDVTVILRAMYLVDNRVEVLRRIRGYTRTKIIFDIDARQVSPTRMAEEVRAAGFDGLEVRPFFESMRFVPSTPLRLALFALEHSGPVARVLARRRGRLFYAAFSTT
jgi:hypothetical protein